MPLRRSTFVLFLFTLVPLAFGGSKVLGQKAQLDKDQVEVTHYTLTMDNLTHVMQATQALNQAAKADPSLSIKDDSSDEQQSIAQMSAKLSSIPKAVAILTSYSLTPRTYSLALMSMIQTGFAAAAISAGAKEADIVSSGGASAANLAFFRAHKAEIDALSKKYPMQS